MKFLMFITGMLKHNLSSMVLYNGPLEYDIDTNETIAVS